MRPPRPQQAQTPFQKRWPREKRWLRGPSEYTETFTVKGHGMSPRDLGYEMAKLAQLAQLAQSKCRPGWTCKVLDKSFAFETYSGMSVATSEVKFTRQTP
jgi:hypothetical protein